MIKPMASFIMVSQIRPIQIKHNGVFIPEFINYAVGQSVNVEEMWAMWGKPAVRTFGFISPFSSLKDDSEHFSNFNLGTILINTQDYLYSAARVGEKQIRENKKWLMALVKQLGFKPEIDMFVKFGVYEE